MKKKNYKLQPTPYTLTIGWLYPELMNTYGDKGNIITLQKRCEWRGIQTEIKHLNVGFTTSELKTCNLLFMGGAQDKQQAIVSEDLKQKAKALKSVIENGTPGLYICGAYQFLGKYYKEADGTIIKGLGIFDLYTENPGENHPRLIGNILIEARSTWDVARSKTSTPYNLPPTTQLVGFENHGGRTYLGLGVQPLGTVEIGFGNNGSDKTEGAVYKNSFGSYLHGPILPKNPHFADYLIQLALERKHKTPVELKTLDNGLELQAHDFMVKKVTKK